MEGKRSDTNAAALLAIYQGDQALGAKHFDGDWMKLSNVDAGAAYAWALANIECIVQSGGMSDVDRILTHLSAGESPEAVVKEVLHSDYAELTHDTAAYLRKTYTN